MSQVPSQVQLGRATLDAGWVGPGPGPVQGLQAAESQSGPGPARRGGPPAGWPLAT
jgi:hypothetical protein